MTDERDVEQDDEDAIAEIMAEYRVSRSVAMDMLAFRRYGGDLEVVPSPTDAEREEVGLGRGIRGRGSVHTRD
jgi:hypothetical protein